METSSIVQDQEHPCTPISVNSLAYGWELMHHHDEATGPMPTVVDMPTKAAGPIHPSADRCFHRVFALEFV